MKHELNEKIRTLREMNHWSQEKVAEQMNMSTNGYAKIERGETRPNIDRLTQIANIFNVDMAELLDSDNGGMIFVVGDNNNSDLKNYYSSAASLAAENDTLKLTISHKDDIIAHKDELLAQLRSENDTLKALVEALKNRT